MKKWNEIWKSKTFLMGLLGCVLAVTAIAGAIAFSSGNDNEGENQYIDLEDPTGDYLWDSSSAVADLETTVEEAETTEKETSERSTRETTTTETEDTTNESTLSADAEGAGEGESAEPVAGDAGALNFSADSSLLWPVEGNVILDFSMDQTTYFATLKQYKTNPAIIIQSEVNSSVTSSADAIVEEIGYNEEIGNYVVLNFGNDYKGTYGQLKELTVAVGNYVNAGDVIGHVAETTKYYVVEGTNVYFKLTYGGEPIDPLDYIR